jgi:hypothetical protein
MTLTDTVPVLCPSVRGMEELAAIGRSVTGRECLKRSHAPEPPFCMVGGRWPRSKRARASWMICALREADLVRAYVDAVRAT